MVSRSWVIADAMIPERSSGGHRSHESLCLLNLGDDEASVVVEAFFADREPVASAPIVIGAARSAHVRTDEPEALGGLRIPHGVPYGLVVRSEAELHLQYSRLDTTQPAYALMTAIVPEARA